MVKTWCVGGKHYSKKFIQKVLEKKPKTKNSAKIIKGVCSICGRNKSQISTK